MRLISVTSPGEGEAVELDFFDDEPTLVEVMWEDVETYAGWNPEAGDVEPPVFTTVGYLVKDEEHKLIISDTKEGLGNVTVFPSGVVLEVVELERVEEGDE